MAFSYQKSFALPTENVGHDLLFSLLRDHNVAHMVDRIRALKSTADSRDWTQEREFQEWFGRNWVVGVRKRVCDSTGFV